MEPSPSNLADKSNVGGILDGSACENTPSGTPVGAKATQPKDATMMTKASLRIPDLPSSF
ncbi:MAG: hypothetical protein AAGA53_15430 [Pseudomonadota bacterium]